jgi:hypothetical protein
LNLTVKGVEDELLQRLRENTKNQVKTDYKKIPFNELTTDNTEDDINEQITARKGEIKDLCEASNAEQAAKNSPKPADKKPAKDEDDAADKTPDGKPADDKAKDDTPEGKPATDAKKADGT